MKSRDTALRIFELTVGLGLVVTASLLVIAFRRLTM